MGWTRIISGLFAVLVLAGPAYADLPPMPQPDSPRPAEGVPRGPSNEFEAVVTARLAASPWFYDRVLSPPTFDGPAAVAASPPHVLADHQNGLHLCLYALLSLGLFKSAPCVKKLSWGVIPGWYHEGGPFQIGHRLAIAPDCLNSALVCCFVQPEYGAETSPPPHRDTIVSLWRRSQSVPTARAARAPPGKR